VEASAASDIERALNVNLAVLFWIPWLTVRGEAYPISS
jgi:hypothetical protein